MPVPTPAAAMRIETIGEVVGTIPVQLGGNFLQHFSEQLYSSPHKAFEELIANSWDAGARTVWIRLSPDLNDPGAVVAVLDDGTSMDQGGLSELWQVAYSTKRSKPSPHGRPCIGKFGIGKLATYVLANKLTYVCRAQDGQIRAVTMDYGYFKPDKNGKPVFIEDLQLELRRVEQDEVRSLLKQVPGGAEIADLIDKGLPPVKQKGKWDDEYGGKPAPAPEPSGCWTLVVLSDLKPEGRQIKRGIVRRMIQSSLPLGADLTIVLNDEVLSSAKSTKEIRREWIIGRELGFSVLELQPEDGIDDPIEEVPVATADAPYPHVEIPGVGKVSGGIKLFAEKVSGGKSEEIGSSNGFFINVLGRVVNHDPTFGEKDLSHSAWARFRMTVRADGLDSALAVNREQFAESRPLRLFRAFLRKCFNLARKEYDSWISAAWEDSGAAIVNAYGTLPVAPVREIVSEALSGSQPIAGLVDDSGIADRSAALEEWKRDTDKDARQVIASVGFDDLNPEDSLSRYRVSTRSLVVNASHPFVQEHSATNEQKIVLRNIALLEFLTDVHALETGVDPVIIEDLRQYRDGMARLIAKVSRKSGAQIARLLLEVGTYKDPTAFEVIVSDALEYLGYQVERLGVGGVPGEPEGVARAYPTPTSPTAAQAGAIDTTAKKEIYSFTFDAKSSKTGKVKAGDVRASGLARHRVAKKADHALVVAPEFDSGALEEECKANQVTPIRAHDLGRLLTYTAEFGAIPLTKLRELFTLYDPDDVGEWVEKLETWLKANRRLTLDVFIRALKQIDGDIPDTLSAGLLADRCRKVSKHKDITDNQVLAVARGLQIVVPDLIRVDQKNIIVSVHPDKMADAIANQLNALKQAKPASDDAQV